MDGVMFEAQDIADLIQEFFGRRGRRDHFLWLTQSVNRIYNRL
jgi:hypothetical protein